VDAIGAGGGEIDPPLIARNIETLDRHRPSAVDPGMRIVVAAGRCRAPRTGGDERDHQDDKDRFREPEGKGGRHAELGSRRVGSEASDSTCAI
jgi:hypothetical protein